VAHAQRRGAIEDMSHLLIGEDPTRVEHLWQMMYRQHFWHGHGIVRATAIAGIDLALWDIVGKVANMPLSKVFGGPVRDYVRTYCHLGGGKMEDFYQTPADNAKRFAELAQQPSRMATPPSKAWPCRARCRSKA
jgi:galactonate dehydratase